jgi:hypothetical protein
MLFVRLLKRLALVRFEEQTLFLAIWNSSNIFVSESCLEIALAVSDSISANREKDLLSLIIYAFVDQPKILAIILTILTQMDIQHRWIYYAKILEHFPNLTEILTEVLKVMPLSPKLSTVLCLLLFVVNRNSREDFRISSSLEIDGILLFI